MKGKHQYSLPKNTLKKVILKHGVHPKFSNENSQFSTLFGMEV